MVNRAVVGKIKLGRGIKKKTFRTAVAASYADFYLGFKFISVNRVNLIFLNIL